MNDRLPSLGILSVTRLVITHQIGSMDRVMAGRRKKLGMSEIGERIQLRHTSCSCIVSVTSIHGGSVVWLGLDDVCDNRLIGENESRDCSDDLS